MQRGVTLFELLIVLVLLGLLALIATPRLFAMMDGAAVREETTRLAGALDAARGAALRLSSSARLTLTDSSYAVEATVDTTTVIAWQAPGPRVSGVHLSGAGQAIIFSPAGVAMGASNRTLVLSRGAAARKVVVSRLGRVSY